MKAWWLTAALLIAPAWAPAQSDDDQEADRKAQQAAIQKLLAQAQAADEEEDADDEAAPGQPAAATDDEAPTDPEDLRIVAQQRPTLEESLPEPTELNLSGSAVNVSVLGTDSVVITANEHDLAILKALIESLDRDLPTKVLRVVKLEERPASEVAASLQQAIRELYPRDDQRPETKVSITAVASNILLIVAPDTKIDQIVAVAKVIDAAAPEIRAEMMVFTVTHRKAAEAAERLREIITKLRQKQGGTADEFTIEANDANNTIMVFGPTSERETIQMFLDQIDVEAVPGFGELRLVLFPLVNADAGDLAQMFTDMLEASEGRGGATETIRRLIMLKRSGDGMVELPPLDLEKTLKMIPHEDTNSVLVVTVEENIEPVGEIIAMLDDVPLSVDMNLRFFPLRHADAKTVSEALDELFTAGRDLPKAAEGGKNIDGAVPISPEGEAMVFNIGIIPDLRTNTVIVTGRPVQLELCARIIQQIDQPATALKFPLRMLFLGDRIDATRVGQIIETLWEQRLDALEAQDAGKTVIERERVFLAVDIRSNALILSANEENYDEISEICRKLDTASDRLIDQIRIINCNKTSAADLQAKIEDLWQRKADLRREGDVPEDLPVIVADQRSNALVIASSREDYDEIKRLVDKLESQPLAPIAAIRLIELVNNDASEISQMIEDLFDRRMEQRLVSGQEENPSDRVALVFDAPTNTILVASTLENYEEMVRIIDVLDAEPDLEGVVKTFVLQNAEATKVAETIEELFDEGLYNPSTGLDSTLTEERMKIAIVAEPRANAIIVSASKPNLSIIARLVEQMDSPDTPLRENTKLFALQFADAVKLTDMLERLFAGMKSNAPDPDIFAEPTIIPDDRSNVLIVSGTRDAMKRCEDLIVQLDRAAGPPTSTFEIYPLAHASAVKLAPIMQDMFDKRDEGGGDERTPINLYAEEGSNSLICSAARDDHILVVGLLELLDKPSTIAQQFRIFPLAKAKAQPLAERLDQLFQSRAESSGSDAQAVAIAVEPDERTNALIVWASPSEMENIATIIHKLDTTEPAVEMAIRVIQLKQALAEDLAQVLQETLIGESGGAGEESQAIIVTYMALTEDGTREERKLIRQDLIITPDARTNTLTVMAPADSMDMLEAMIRDFDKIRPILAEVRLFPLINADAEEIVERLEALFEAGGDEGEQTLVVTAATATSTNDINMWFCIDTAGNVRQSLDTRTYSESQ
ncbi:MAG: hypothetical protein IID40_04600 [Planctomycetes bacterium]|nr:hypothetical protein [Planctomycetota bacterium]